MNVREDLSADHPRSASIGKLLRQALAAASICVLAGIGIYIAWQERSSGWEDVLLALAVTLGPATAYAFGYFRCLREALGGSAVGQQGTVWQRWSSFARFSAVVAILMTSIGWAVSLAHSSGLEVSEAVQAVAALLVLTFLIPACVVASEEYLARRMLRGNGFGGVGWRAAVRRLAGRLGVPPVKLLVAKPSLVSGSTLALASLFLTTTLMSSCGSGDPRKGYEIVSSNALWITAARTVQEDTAKAILAQVGRWSYVAGLAVSLLALAAVLVGPAGDRLRRSRLLGIVSGTLALFGICDFTFAWIRLLSPSGSLTSYSRRMEFEWADSAVGIVVWLLPIALWLWRARGAGEQWAYTRLAVMVLYLPILFFSLAFLIFLVPSDGGARGYVSFLVGMLLVWWGFIQSQWEGVPSP